ncbi:NAD(P)H-dependent oxidoreductase [Enterococcus caccae]|uniref:Nitroreductase domain-containing protein n=1 Tax=Enterococcus caccae ATCC BAA-1240 TaxID=1158612 RepID=R3WB93_9ENTE|nr:NAD(P)H-dependent oxidoreductase [Enterococcus caccae]EOL45196.1 hypothetical protein UC7_02002 [Enterococcus caccae ATCC BAA-1240]EOT58603.1 hypothetical protein I580_02774 [Enterococcus caccae ATCC BAA-1240]
MTNNSQEKRQKILTAFEHRHATKSFDPTKKIPTEDWETILEAARLSPSSFGYEPWSFLLIENSQIKEELKEFAWGAINSLNGASHFIIALARKNVTAESSHVKHMVEDVFGLPFSPDAPQTQMFKQFQVNDFDLNSERSLFDWASKQTYIALANMMTTAALLEIDSCPIEGFNRADVETYLSKKGLLDTNEFGVSYMLGLGYRTKEIPLKKRQSMDEILTVIE